jgi:hypothetical protein
VAAPEKGFGRAIIFFNKSIKYKNYIVYKNIRYEKHKNLYSNFFHERIAYLY